MHYERQCRRVSTVPVQARTLVLHGARFRKYVVDLGFQRIPRTLGYYRRAKGWHVQVSHFTSHISSDTAILVWTIEERRKKLPLPKYLINTILRSNLPCVYKRMCQWYDTEKLVSTPKRSEDDEQIDLDPEQFTIITQKHQKMPQARGDSLLQLTENRETQIHRASELADYARTVESGQIFFTNGSVMDGNSSALSCRWYAELRNSQNSILQSIPNPSHQDRASDRIWYLNLQELWFLKYKVHSRKLGNSKHLSAYIKRNRTVRTTIYSNGYWPPQFLGPRCHCSGRAAVDREHERPVDDLQQIIKAAPKPQLLSIGFIQRDWKINPSKSNTKGMVNSSTFPSIWRRFYGMEVVMKLTEASRWTHV